MVTALSAALMLAALTVFWNLFILPDRALQPGSKAIINSAEKAGESDKTGTGNFGNRPDTSGASLVSAQESGASSKNTSPTESASGSGKASAAPEKKALQEEPDMSSAVKPIEGALVKSYGFVFAPTFKDYRFHGGVDIKGSEGASVKCMLKGVVENITVSEGEGHTVTVNHGGGWKSVCSHMDTLKVRKNTALEAGDVLGFLGAPGEFEKAEGCHLHLEILHNGEKVDPLEYLQYKE